MSGWCPLILIPCITNGNEEFKRYVARCPYCIESDLSKLRHGQRFIEYKNGAYYTYNFVEGRNVHLFGGKLTKPSYAVGKINRKNERC